MHKVKHDFQVSNQEISFGNVWMIQNGFTFFDPNNYDRKKLFNMFNIHTINCMQYSEPVVIP